MPCPVEWYPTIKSFQQVAQWAGCSLEEAEELQQRRPLFFNQILAAHMAESEAQPALEKHLQEVAKNQK